MLINADSLIGKSSWWSGQPATQPAEKADKTRYKMIICFVTTLRAAGVFEIIDLKVHYATLLQDVNKQKNRVCGS